MVHNETHASLEPIKTFIGWGSLLAWVRWDNYIKHIVPLMDDTIQNVRILISSNTYSYCGCYKRFCCYCGKVMETNYILVSREPSNYVLFLEQHFVEREFVDVKKVDLCKYDLLHCNDNRGLNIPQHFLVTNIVLSIFFPAII